MNYNKKKLKKVRVNISLSEDVLYLAREVGIDNLSAYIESVLIRKIKYVYEHDPELRDQHNSHYAKLDFYLRRKKFPALTVEAAEALIEAHKIANITWTENF